MKVVVSFIIGIAVGSSLSMLMAPSNDHPPPPHCDCRIAIERALAQERSSTRATLEAYKSLEPAQKEAATPSFKCPVPVPCPAPAPAPKSPVEETAKGEHCAVAMTPPAPVNLAASEAALTRYHVGKWGGKSMGRAGLLCYVNNNQQLVDESGRVSYVWDHDSPEWKETGVTINGKMKGQTELFQRAQDDCLAASLRVNSKSTVDDKFRKVSVNGKVISVDDIVWGYERIFQSQELFSAVSWLGVSMQQTPNDAFVIADMLWRLRPDLLIELGTSGGGSAHFLMHVMEQYNPKAKLLTMDPALPGAGSARSEPLVAWNAAAVRRFCPHCTPANESAVWKRGNIHFVRKIPDSSEAIEIAEAFVSRAKTVMVIEDSTHEYKTVLSNIKAYGKYVTPGSYMLVQDTRCGRWKPADAVEQFLQEPEGKDFSVDPRWEYMVFSQHSGGFLRKSGSAEQGPSW